MGFRSVEEFSKELVKTKGFVYPSTFNRAVEMVVGSGADVQRCLIVCCGAEGPLLF